MITKSTCGDTTALGQMTAAIGVLLKNVSRAEGVDYEVFGRILVQLAKHGNLPSIRFA
jgi:hypothetical protein